MNSTTVRRVTLSIAVASALAGVAACGASDAGEGGKAAGRRPVRVSPIAALRTAETSTDKAESAKVRSTMTLGSAFSMTASGSMSWSRGIRGTMNIAYTGGKMADAMRATGNSSLETRYLPDGFYVNMGDKLASVLGGKHWLEYAYDDLAKIGGGSGAYLKDQMRSTAPKEPVTMLLASGQVKKVGEETVEGQHTTHYAGTLNVGDMMSRTSHRLSAAQLAKAKKQLEESGVTAEHVDVWIDDQNLMVKQTQKARFTKGPMVGPMTVTAYYTDYGTPVSAAAPRADDTENFTDFMKTLAAMRRAHPSS
ncbi:hypothetical protein [Streptomyces sp. NPDC046985]|uniref:hypothetical protein n=1 Tax=Streptomyces sp. NPDC046985 TaxID=3155377 RepID=UPI003403461A